MSHVTVFSPSARSVKIATTPGKYLTEVRDEACKKFNVSPDQFTLKYNNKPVSLSQQIRLANLPQGARLELVQASRSPTVVSVALQLPASRLTEKFASNTSLWEILRHFESGKGANYNFTQRGVPEMNSNGTTGAGRLNYEMPVITVMPGHREQSSFVGLQQTLSQLGFENGSALLRLSFKNSGKPLEEAMTEITQYFKSPDPSGDGVPPAGAHSATTSQATSLPDVDRAAPEASEVIAGEPVKDEVPGPDPMDISTTPAVEKAPPFIGGGSSKVAENIAPARPASPPAVVTPSNVAPSAVSSSIPSSPPLPQKGHRNIQIFAAPTSATPQAARNAWIESDYVPSIEHAKAHQAALQNKTRNTRLLSDKELEIQEAARQEKVTAVAEKGASLRIRMPDQTIIQMNIYSGDTAEDLYNEVQDKLQHNEPFLLKYVGPKGQQVLIPRSNARLIHDLQFSRKEIVTFVWDEAASAQVRVGGANLNSEWAAKAQKLEVREPMVEDSKEEIKQEGKSEGKKKFTSSSSGDKESKLKSMLNKSLFKR